MYDLEDCTTALRRNGDDLERAANWLFDKDAPRILQAERVGGFLCPQLHAFDCGNVWYFHRVSLLCATVLSNGIMSLPLVPVPAVFDCWHVA